MASGARLPTTQAAVLAQTATEEDDLRTVAEIVSSTAYFQVMVPSTVAKTC